MNIELWPEALKSVFVFVIVFLIIIATTLPMDGSIYQFDVFGNAN